MENQRILPEYSLVLKGTQLKGDIVEISIGGINVPHDEILISDNELVFKIPPSLSAGIHGVQVIHKNDMGSPPEPHRGVESNVAAFVLSPDILTINVAKLNSLTTATISIQPTLIWK